MTIKPLYKYIENNQVVVSPNKPNTEYTEMYRLIANSGKNVTNGDVVAPCIDVDTADGWCEVVGDNPDPDEIDDSEALAIITGGEPIEEE